jgi:hypothetical protein
MSESNSSNEAWRDILSKCGAGSLFIDSPMGKSVFTYGAAYVLAKLEPHCDPDAWESIREEFATFQATYRRDSR